MFKELYDEYEFEIETAYSGEMGNRIFLIKKGEDSLNHLFDGVNYILRTIYNYPELSDESKRNIESKIEIIKNSSVSDYEKIYDDTKEKDYIILGSKIIKRGSREIQDKFYVLISGINKTKQFLNKILSYQKPELIITLPNEITKYSFITIEKVDKNVYQFILENYKSHPHLTDLIDSSFESIFKKKIGYTQIKLKEDEFLSYGKIDEFLKKSYINPANIFSGFYFDKHDFDDESESPYIIESDEDKKEIDKMYVLIYSDRSYQLIEPIDEWKLNNGFMDVIHYRCDYGKIEELLIEKNKLIKEMREMRKTIGKISDLEIYEKLPEDIWDEIKTFLFGKYKKYF